MNMNYETFIRSAFSINESNMVDRWGDPASLANTDTFAYGDINDVKAAVAYSMAIFNTTIVNRYSDQLSGEDSSRLESIIGDVINAQDKIIINDLITEYRENFVNRFIRFPWQ